MSRTRTKLALFALATALSGCYVVPVRGPDGTVMYDHYPLPPVGAPMPMAVPAPGPGAPGQMPAVLNARLYPSNEQAAQSGIVSGTVTNMMTGKGRFPGQLHGRGPDRRSDPRVERGQAWRGQCLQSEGHLHVM
jgi:hypothetical protein